MYCENDSAKKSDMIPPGSYAVNCALPVPNNSNDIAAIANCSADFADNQGIAQKCSPAAVSGATADTALPSLKTDLAQANALDKAIDALATLRKLGYSVDDPRCQTLAQLIHAVRAVHQQRNLLSGRHALTDAPSEDVPYRESSPAQVVEGDPEKQRVMSNAFSHGCDRTADCVLCSPTSLSSPLGNAKEDRLHIRASNFDLAQTIFPDRALPFEVAQSAMRRAAVRHAKGSISQAESNTATHDSAHSAVANRTAVGNSSCEELRDRKVSHEITERSDFDDSIAQIVPNSVLSPKSLPLNSESPASGTDALRTYATSNLMNGIGASGREVRHSPVSPEVQSSKPAAVMLAREYLPSQDKEIRIDVKETAHSSIFAVAAAAAAAAAAASQQSYCAVNAVQLPDAGSTSIDSTDKIQSGSKLLPIGGSSLSLVDDFADSSAPRVAPARKNVPPSASSLIFQTRAQISAFRSLSRGVDPPPEVLIASAGKRFRAPAIIFHSPHQLGQQAKQENVQQPGQVISNSVLRQRAHRACARQNRLRSALENGLPSDTIGIESDGTLSRSCPVSETRTWSSCDIQANSMRSLDSSLSRNCPSALDVRGSDFIYTKFSTGLPMFCQDVESKTFEQLTLDRNRRIRSRVDARLSELSDLSAELPDDARRQVIIEMKSLKLLRLQRTVRSQVMAVMHRLLSQPRTPGFGPMFLKKYRKNRPTLHSVSSHGANASRGKNGFLSKEARERIKAMERRYREEQALRQQKSHAKFAASFLNHSAEVRNALHNRSNLVKKLFKDLERHFRDKAREEDRRKKKEQHDRLRALRNNDEDEYLALVQNTKNTRLLQLLRQTDEYLAQLGAKVEAQKEAARAELETSGPVGDDRLSSGGARSGASEGLKQNEESSAQHQGTALAQASDNPDSSSSIQAMRARRHQYYTISHSIQEKVRQPKSLVGGTLKPYQIDGLEWMVSLYNNGLNGILADEMGLGKTIQTIALLTYLVENKANEGPFLIIVPLSTISNWVREFEAWAPSLIKVVYRGNPEMRKNVQQKQMRGRSYNVVLTTYEFVVKDKLFLGKIVWKYIIIDEGHRMKNADCKLALTLGAKYRTRNRILLTGTPLQNNLTELWALLNFLLPTIFSSAETFETWFNAPFQASSLGGSAELNEEEQLLVISRLHQVLRPFMLRRLKTDVETQLPDKVEIVLRCDMSVWQRVLYRQMSSKLGIASSGSVRMFNNVVMQLKKVCNHPYLFYNEEELHCMPADHLIRSSGKFSMLEHALLKLKAARHRVLVFSQMTAALDYLEYFLAALGLKYMRLDGTTKADDRHRMLIEFNAEDSEHFCFLLSTRAGGLGLNLQTADTVFIFDSDWNPMMDLQAQDRAHRIGQTKEVRVFRLITARSVEEKILERANRKLQMDAQVIQAGQFNNQSSESDRTQMLKEILQAQAKGDEEEDDIPTLEDLNRVLARSDEEFDLFQQMDVKRVADEDRTGKPRLMMDESELPPWVLKPELHQRQSSKLEEEIDFSRHGRGRRKRSEVTYDDGLTEKEWTNAVERDEDIIEASRRKRRKLSENGGTDGVGNSPAQNKGHEQ